MKLNQLAKYILNKRSFCSQNQFFKNHKQVEVIYSDVNDIHFNIATEEYLYEHMELNNPILFLWRNDKNIVIGRHQNPWKECFLQQMQEDKIKLCRRRTGGGAVYQDLGNSCFSFLTPIFGEMPPLNCKEYNNKILINSLNDWKINAEVSGRNDITVDSFKVSGSAYQVSLGKTNGDGKKCLHHGTMLINVNTSDVSKYLNPNKKKLQSKGVDSVVSRIMNLNQKNPNLDHQKLCQSIEKQFIQYYNCEVKRSILDRAVLEKIPKIQQIYNELKSWEWIYERTPEFNNSIETRFDWGIVDFQFHIKNGLIINGKVYSDCLYPNFIDKVNQILQSNTILYDMNGMNELSNQLKNHFKENEILVQYSNDLNKWLVQSI